MMQTKTHSLQCECDRVELALEDLRQGKMIILTDDPDRENEGDLIMAAELVTPALMAFMIHHSTGIVCLSLTASQLHKLDLPMMVPDSENTSSRGTPFALPIDAKEGITTGVSAADRVKTIQAAIHQSVTPGDLVKPGHVFPLRAKDGGVIERRGHTEGSVDLVRLAGLQPAAVLCEVMHADGTMARGKALETFAVTHGIKKLSINDIVAYRLQHENHIVSEVTTQLPLQEYGDLPMTVVRDSLGHDYVVFKKTPVSTRQPMLARVHSSCLTGDLFRSERCDCYDQLHHSLKRISKEGGILIYLNQEGRGIGLFNKIKAYVLQEQGFDTVEANTQLGLPVDARDYYMVANILRYFHINHVRLLTNNPQKISELEKSGICVQQEPLPSFHQDKNLFYLSTKRKKLDHTIDLEGY
ncbi:MAG TPA: 3,4-dihydroxy-2-butanone-4-phosphate synthase [Gammaproteobacteria bacterium]|jgi:3,4-dihydroxy 2-butanone 4-phosphate synthase/GTP cyclohydrolase II|nr:3,4-dihydroxy-2-butanone-4-phosphate synthase [Gammaproteobacteria bacterium]